jgi:hypothetical protein
MADEFKALGFCESQVSKHHTSIKQQGLTLGATMVNLDDSSQFSQDVIRKNSDASRFIESESHVVHEDWLTDNF